MSSAEELQATKKQKTESSNEETFFEPVGNAVQEVDDPNAVKQTGAFDAQGHPVQEVESLCMNCGKNGTTRILLTSIPYFRETIIMSFECPHCGLKNSEVQPASEIQMKGCRYHLKIENKADFNRQVIKSESCTCKFVELDIEIPAKRGQLTTVEGLLKEMVEDLEMDQPKRKEIQPEIYAKIDQFIKKVNAALNCKGLPMNFVADDPAGNSWVEFIPGEAQHKWSCTQYKRTPEQDQSLGLQPQHEQAAAATATDEPELKSSGFEGLENEVQTFHATCSACGAPCETHMKMVDIPHFKQVIIMSTACQKCGYKSNEVKTGGAIPEKGKRIVLKCDDADDLSRDILKSETCSMEIPELQLDLTPGTLGGRFTTLEGLLREVRDGLFERVYTETSDSMDPETKKRWDVFFQRIDEALAGKVNFTVLMEDPMAQSYIQNIYAPDPDPNMAEDEFERTQEQNDDLGISDMKT